ncbi:MAG: B12-binding domain-containing radical SAM protein, partial [Planctomycetota bacterium]
RKESTGFLEQAFRKDFEQNGPSIYRICRTTLEGWKRYRDHPDLRIRQRFGRDVRQLKTSYSAALWAMEHRLRSTNEAISAQINALRREIETECGGSARWAARIFGPLLVWTIKREEKRLARGRTHEPRTFRDRANWSRPAWRPAVGPRPASAAWSS